MQSPYSRSSQAVPDHPIRDVLTQFPVVCFTLTLLTDVAFWRTGNLLWQNFSSWLLLAGLVGGGLAALAGFVGLFSRSGRMGWPSAVGGIVVLVLALVNSFVHAADGWTAVVPNGLILSAVTVIMMVVTALLGRFLVNRHRTGVRSHV